MYNEFVKAVRRHIKENLIVYSMVLLCFLIGSSVGAFTTKIIDKHQKEQLFFYLKDFFQVIHNNELNNLDILKQTLINNIQLIILNWLVGTLIITAPIALIVVAFKGFLIGFTTSILIEKFNFLGGLIFLFGILPQNIILIPSFIFSAVTTLTFSSSFIKNKIRNPKETSYSKGYFLYSYLFIIIMLFIFIGSIIESYIAPIFIRILSV